MGIDCSCMRTDLLEEKTIMIGDTNHLKKSFIVEASEKVGNSNEILNETLEKSDGNFNLLNSLCRRYLAKNVKPGEIYEIIEGSLNDYVHEQIRFCESFLTPVSVPINAAVFRLNSGEIYQGNFDGLLRKSGFGIQVLVDEKYTGNFVRGLRSGYGRLIRSDGNLYEGDFFKNHLEGEGACLEAGIKYRGTFKLGQKSGHGQEDWPDKTSYIGEFENNLKHGKGKFTWANGNKYKGSFEYGNISGKGRFKWKNGNEYKGQWKDNQMHGIGVFKWPDGRIYTGEYFEDKKHGRGTIVWPDQREYEGEWVNGLQHGEGVYKWFNKMKGVQESRTGIWEAGNRMQWVN